ncbi:MAG: hypothetical protein GQ563_00970 [Desulfuromusa sp.]|nr:hypothetical protein [Desulfuromusa sp.]
MDLDYNKNVNDAINQVTKNMDQLFGLFTTVQKQVEKLSTLIVDEATGTTQKVSKQVIAAGGKISEETVRVAQENLDNTVKTVFTDGEKK